MHYRALAFLLISGAAVSSIAQKPLTEAELKQLQAKAKQELQETLRSFAAEALEKNVEGSADERRERAIALREELRGANRQSIRRAFDAVAVRPGNIEAAIYIIKSSNQAFGLGSQVLPGDIAAPIEEMYRERSRSGSAGIPAVEWQQGLAELLVIFGRHEEAREQIRSVVVQRGDGVSPYARVLAAVIERLNGDPLPLRRLLANCTKSDHADEASFGDNYCWNTVRTIAARAVNLNATKNLSGMVDLIVEYGRTLPEEYSSRLWDLGDVLLVDAATARRELATIVGDENAPDGARHDAAASLATIATFEHDTRTAIAWQDCALHFRGVAFPEFPKDGWPQLVTLAKKPRTSLKPCGNDEKETACVASLLSNRVFAATNERSWLLARQSIEHFASWTLANDVNVAYVAHMIHYLGEAQLRSGLEQEGIHTIEFALLLDPRLEVGKNFKALAIAPAHETATPWDSPTNIGEPIPQVCPR